MSTTTDPILSVEDLHVKYGLFEAVFVVAWLLAAHVSELACSAYKVFEIAGESVLLTRDDEGRATEEMLVPVAFVPLIGDEGW